MSSPSGSTPSFGDDRDADAGVDHDGVAGEIVGRAHRFADPPRQDRGVERLLDAGLDDGEFVAADARDGVGVAHAMAQPLGHHLEQLVADRMAERVVDALEAVEIEIEHRKLARRG